ncbi:MAG: SDR family NAD(P)-dependent oxidoreductase [Candidatus Izemoplasmataceae bacterium]
MSKKAFITGASRGIGRGIALRLANEGYDIAFTYYTEEDDAKSLKEAINALNQECFYYQASLQETSIVESVTHQAIKDLGGIDVLVCNAGKTKFTSIKTLEIDTMDFLYQLNFRSYMIATKIVANTMIEKNTKGRIIFITSTRGIRAYDNDCIYGAIKAALNRAVESLAIELAPNKITVNAVAPGATKVRGSLDDEALKEGHISRLVPLKRSGSPEDVANLVNFLVSDEAEYITGDIIKIDGGLILYGPNERKEA